MIYFKNIKTNISPVNMPFNDLDSDNSDACIINSNYTVTSNNRLNGIGGYDLYLCDNSTGKKWSLSSYNSEVNTLKNELGSVYTPTIN